MQYNSDSPTHPRKKATKYQQTETRSTCLGQITAVSRAWKKAIIGRDFLWNTYRGRTHHCIEAFDVWTARMGPGPVDLRLIFESGPVGANRVSATDLTALMNTVSQRCVTLALSMLDESHTDVILSTMHSSRFPRMSNLSITVSYNDEHAYNDSAVPTPGPATFSHFPDTLKDPRLDGHHALWTMPKSFALLTTFILNRLGIDNAPTVKEFEALFEAALNLERLALSCVAASPKGASGNHLLTMNKLKYIHYTPVGDFSLGRLISRLEAPNMTHLELEMWDIKDFEVLTLCRRAFRPATNLNLAGFTFTDDVTLGATCELLPMASHVDLTSASVFLRLMAYAALPLWPKLAQLRIQEQALVD
ncbi:hypothetical protein DFH08DRAFT_804600 [Mycena albidolilacea]|uniref:Uncharacterized protein n=1 Tax=Mycena albidolilacea TaxID=1033008 RepID=A0AAD7A9N0_9AGAR|nr:hypothetical protein DFH08DRAFT_804600 [Mycena albidolilacea]